MFGKGVLAGLMILTLGANASAQSGLMNPESIFNFKSETEFNEFISPMTNPVFFEDPRLMTEARFIFANHRLPSTLGGGEVQLYALQLRARLTENLAFIATKDGFFVSHADIMDDGWADVAAGLKLALWRDEETQTLLSTGFTYELPSGEWKALQGNGDGEFNIFLNGGAELLEGMHWVSATGFRLPADRTQENQVWYWSNHLDQMIGNTGLYLFGETNWYHWMRDADAFALPVGGLDVINLGSVNIAGNDVVSGALGVKYKPADNMEIGVAYEVPLTPRQDILKDRLGVDFIIRY